MGSELNDASSSGGSSDNVVTGRSGASDFARENEGILNSRVMVIAYAISVVILAVGLVVFTVMLGYLCFMYPDKANAFLILLGSPLAAVVVMHAKGALEMMGQSKN